MCSLLQKLVSKLQLARIASRRREGTTSPPIRLRSVEAVLAKFGDHEGFWIISYPTSAPANYTREEEQITNSRRIPDLKFADESSQLGGMPIAILPRPASILGVFRQSAPDEKRWNIARSELDILYRLYALGLHWRMNKSLSFLFEKFLTTK